MRKLLRLRFKRHLTYNVKKAYQDILLNPNIGKDVKNGSVSQMKKSVLVLIKFGEEF